MITEFILSLSGCQGETTRPQNVLGQIDGPARCGDSESIVVSLSGLSFHDGWAAARRMGGKDGVRVGNS